MNSGVEPVQWTVECSRYCGQWSGIGTVVSGVETGTVDSGVESVRWTVEWSRYIGHWSGVGTVDSGVESVRWTEEWNRYSGHWSGNGSVESGVEPIQWTVESNRSIIVEWNRYNGQKDGGIGSPFVQCVRYHRQGGLGRSVAPVAVLCVGKKRCSFK